MVKTSAQQVISPFILQVFVVLVGLSWLAVVIPALVNAAQQLATNPNLSSFYTLFLYDLLLPVLAFGGFMLWRRRKSGWPLVVESVLLTSIVWLAVRMVSSVSWFITSQFDIALGGELGWWYVELVICAASTAATVAVLWYARRLGKW